MNCLQKVKCYLEAFLQKKSAFIIYHLLKKTNLITEELRNLMVLIMVLVVYSLSNWVQHETGILSVTVSGFILGILRPRGLREIESFKRQLTTLMVSILFILLAAKLDLVDIRNLKLPGLFVLLTVLFGFIHKNKLKFCVEEKDLAVGNKLSYLKKLT